MYHIHPSVSTPSVHPSIICLSMYPFINPSFLCILSIDLSVIHMFIYQSIFLSIYLTIHLSIQLSFYPSIPLSHFQISFLFNVFRDLDHAMLRRLEKRILVDLPIESARRAMFLHHLPSVISTQPINITTTIDYDSVAKVTMSHDFQLMDMYTIYI